MRSAWQSQRRVQPLRENGHCEGLRWTLPLKTTGRRARGALAPERTAPVLVAACSVASVRSSTSARTRRRGWPRFRLILPKLAIVCGVKLKPPGRIADVVGRSPAPSGMPLRVTLQVVSSTRLMSLPIDGGCRERLVEEVEEPDAELDLLIALDREVLEQRDVVVVPRRRAGCCTAGPGRRSGRTPARRCS